MNIPNPTLNDFKRLLKKSNPDLKNLKVEWKRKPDLFNGFGDYKYKLGQVVVSADGFRTRKMMISADATSMMIR